MNLRTLSLTLASAVALAACGSSSNGNGTASSSMTTESSSQASVSSVVSSSMSSVISSASMSSSSMMSSSMSSSSEPANALDCDLYTAAKGQAIYEKDCAFCHQLFDDDGIAIGGVANADPFDANATSYVYNGNTSTDLAAFISAYMPPPGGTCDEDCGINLAVYIKSLTDTPLCAAPMAEYSVSLINASAGQKLSPAAVILNSEPLNLWTIGAPATKALEMLAESGSPQMLLDENPGLANATLALTSQGEINTATFEMMAGKPTFLSVASMPILTNDAVVSIQNVAIDGLAVGHSMMIDAYILDAGTEANTETKETVPGLGVTGAGYAAERNELTGNDQVTLHPGVVSNAELSSSDLSEMHRFDSGSFKVKVTRTQ
ncbi:spondin domain-containing protein [Marinagarivorans algicola]|uniref:spondin domain-containing protein n=1 Tax=Marinagarivorans algicola TaxID=1513270 RepID=UPI0006B9F64B|nr:spondin domain-containing protein [Marinagarivorans algicola]